MTFKLINNIDIDPQKYKPEKIFINFDNSKTFFKINKLLTDIIL